MKSNRLAAVFVLLYPVSSKGLFEFAESKDMLFEIILWEIICSQTVFFRFRFFGEIRCPE